MMQRRDRAARLADVARIGARGAGAADPVAVGVGHDLVYLPDLARRLGPEPLRASFTEEELRGLAPGVEPARYFGVRWAAKRAAAKAFAELAAALHVPAAGLSSPLAYEIAAWPSGVMPYLRLHGRPAALLAEIGARVALSVTHDRDYAAAFVVIARAAAPAYARAV